MAYVPKRNSLGQFDKKNKRNWLKNKEDAHFYNGQAWRKFSKNYKRDNPVCEVKGCTQPSYFSDHIVPISQGGDRWDESNIQALCKSCNARKTANQNKVKYNNF